MITGGKANSYEVTRMNDRQLRVKMGGSESDLQRVRLDDFLLVLRNLEKCFRQIDYSVTKERVSSAFYRLVDLDVGSAAVTIEAVPYKTEENYTNMIFGRLINGIMHILNRREKPEDFDTQLLERVKDLTVPLRRNMRKISLEYLSEQVNVTPELKPIIDEMLSVEYTSEGSVTGYLDALNVHSKSLFYIYPSLSGSRIKCIFEAEVLGEIKKGIKRYVDVSGVLTYKQNELYPYRIEVRSIRVYPEESELPTLGDLRGMAPDMIGKTDSVTYVAN